MKISIFGLGYVGCVGTGCLANLGHEVIGVDISPKKVDLINRGKPTIIEKDIAELIDNGVRAGKISATQDIEYAVKNSDISFIAVGTPSDINGHLKLDYIFNTAKQIGNALKAKDGFHVVAIRSTVLPGTNEQVSRLLEEISYKKRNSDFAVVSNPEFLREGTAVNDYMNPPLTLIGTDNNIAVKIMHELYRDIPGEFVTTDVAVAEIIKYVNNTYHALKIVFANEVGNVCKALNIDSHKVMGIFCKDKQLNISPYYFKPGFAYGGSCLPKDMLAFKTLAHDYYVDIPVIGSIKASNDLQKEKALKIITDLGKKRIGLMGLSFKAGTDDLRNSPIIDVAETLLGKGYELLIYDKNVKLSNITGTNKDFIDAKIPHLHSIIYDDLDYVASSSDVLVIVNRESEFVDIPSRYKNKIIVDLVRMWDSINYKGKYEGINWANINTNEHQDDTIVSDFVATDF